MNCVKSGVKTTEPIWAEDLIDNTEPSFMASNAGVDEATRVHPKVKRLKPKQPKLRRNGAKPRLVAQRANNERSK